MTAGLYFFADVWPYLEVQVNYTLKVWSRGKQFVLFSRESRCFPRWSDEVNLISDDHKVTMVAAQWEEVLASDEGRNTKWLELHIYDIQLQMNNEIFDRQIYKQTDALKIRI